MNSLEKTALRNCHLSILQDLDVKEILPHMFQNGMINSEEYEEFDVQNETQATKCKKLMQVITRAESKCTFLGFIQSLRYNNVYSFLADNLEQTFEELQRNRELKTNDGQTSENVSGFDDHSSPKRSDIMYAPVRKINVFTKSRKTTAGLAHQLKRLSHDGDLETFQKVIKTIDTKFKKNKLNMETSVKDRMGLADMRFACIDAEIGAKRVHYDKSLGEGDLFRNMESVIPFTSNPRVSSMSYLARYGSAVAMKDSIDDGLAHVQFAKEHAEHVSPCRDTGMVYYIEVNLLSQKYEKNPTNYLKASILKTSEQGMAQFNEEDDEIRKDYQRMLLLKMVFCFLGVGLFCKKIEKAETTQTDIEEAKKVIDFIETPDIWKGMEKRRKMLFYVAKTEYYKQQGILDQAEFYAKAAKKLGEENNWIKEFENISQLLVELETKETDSCSISDASKGEDIIAELFGNFPDLEDEPEENDNEIQCSSTYHILNTNQSNHSNTLHHAVQETGETKTQMLDLKEFMLHGTSEITASSDVSNLYLMTASTNAKQGMNETQCQMMNLKEALIYEPDGTANELHLLTQSEDVEQQPEETRCQMMNLKEVMIHDQVEKTDTRTADMVTHSKDAKQEMKETQCSPQMAILKEVMKPDLDAEMTFGTTDEYSQRLMKIKRHNVEQQTDDPQFQTENYSSLGKSFVDKNDKYYIQYDKPDLDITEQAMLYLKSENFDEEKYEISFSNGQSEWQYKQNGDCSQQNDLHLMLLKEYSQINELPFEASHGLSVHTEGDGI